MKSITDLIIGEMKRQGISYRKFAIMIGCSKSTIECWNRGDVNPSIEMADRALKALGLSATIGKEA